VPQLLLHLLLEEQHLQRGERAGGQPLLFLAHAQLLQLVDQPVAVGDVVARVCVLEDGFADRQPLERLVRSTGLPP
jgi:hypothetical protein